MQSGRVVYQGSASSAPSHFASLGFRYDPQATDAADFLLKVRRRATPRQRRRHHTHSRATNGYLSGHWPVDREVHHDLAHSGRAGLASSDSCSRVWLEGYRPPLPAWCVWCMQVASVGNKALRMSDSEMQEAGLVLPGKTAGSSCADELVEAFLATEVRKADKEARGDGRLGEGGATG